MVASEVHHAEDGRPARAVAPSVLDDARMIDDEHRQPPGTQVVSHDAGQCSSLRSARSRRPRPSAWPLRVVPDDRSTLKTSSGATELSSMMLEQPRRAGMAHRRGWSRRLRRGRMHQGCAVGLAAGSMVVGEAIEVAQQPCVLGLPGQRVLGESRSRRLGRATIAQPPRSRPSRSSSSGSRPRGAE